MITSEHGWMFMMYSPLPIWTEVVSHKSTCQKIHIFPLLAVEVKLNRFDVQLNGVIANVTQIIFFFDAILGDYNILCVRCPFSGSIFRKEDAEWKVKGEIKMNIFAIFSKCTFNWKRSHNCQCSYRDTWLLDTGMCNIYETHEFLLWIALQWIAEI